MAFDQKGTPVFSVAQGASGQWEVSEEGFEKPLATFGSAADARDYAESIARTKEGSMIKMIGGQPGTFDAAAPSVVRQ